MTATRSEIDQGIRDFVHHTVTVAVQNTQPAQTRLAMAAHQTLTRYRITTPDALRDALRGGGPYDESTLTEEVGEAVADVFRSWMVTEEAHSSAPHLMIILSTLLDLGDKTMVRMLGRTFMPEPEDLEA